MFNLVIRRGVDIYRKLSLWKRATSKDSLQNQLLTVQYAGEQGIDTGAMDKEFFAVALSEMKSTFFPNGAPIDSTFHVQNGNLRACGQIAATSLSQGGPPPNFLDERVFDVMVTPDIDLTDKDINKYLTEYDQNYIKSLLDDLPLNTNTIIDHGYTGSIHSLKKDEISRSIAVSIITKRSTSLKEYMVGLNSYDVSSKLKSHPDVLKELFVLQSNDDEVDANYLYSILVPQYSPDGSKRKNIEQDIMDSFQDLLFRVEDGSCSFPYQEAIPCNDQLPDEEVSDVSTKSTKVNEEFESADLSVPGIMQWLTGQGHKPIGHKNFPINVNFDHECMKNNPGHRLCFPIVGACAKQITIPVEHMKTSAEFEEVFLLAFGKEQAFARP